LPIKTAIHDGGTDRLLNCCCRQISYTVCPLTTRISVRTSSSFYGWCHSLYLKQRMWRRSLSQPAFF